MMTLLRVCCRCHEQKPLCMFKPDRRKKYACGYCCRACISARDKQRPQPSRPSRRSSATKRKEYHSLLRETMALVYVREQVNRRFGKGVAQAASSNLIEAIRAQMITKRLINQKERKIAQ